MISDALLLTALAALGVAFALATLFLLGHGLWLTLARRHTQLHLARGRAAMAGVISSGEVSDGDLEVVRALPRRVRTSLFAELARSFGGAVRQRVREVAEAVGTVDEAERMLRSRRWWRRLAAARTLTALGASVDVILPLLRDPHPAVRAQVAEWGADHPDPDTLKALLHMLSGTDSLFRFAVQDALLRVGPPAIGPLAEYLSHDDRPGTIPALEVAATLAHPALTGPALSLCSSPHALVRARAAAVLGGGGGEETVARLCLLLSDLHPDVRAAAASALARLRHWPAAAPLADLLRDPVWEVRRAAGLALRALGSPGLLFLQRLRSDPDRFAAEMATHVLDLPAPAREASA